MSRVRSDYLGACDIRVSPAHAGCASKTFSDSCALWGITDPNMLEGKEGGVSGAGAQAPLHSPGTAQKSDCGETEDNRFVLRTQTFLPGLEGRCTLGYT